MQRSRSPEILRVPLGQHGDGVTTTWAKVLAAVSVLGAIAAALLPVARPVQLVAAALCIAGAVVAHTLGKRQRAPRGWIVADDTGVTRFEAGGSARLARWSDLFGVTVLSNHGRTRMVLVFTSPTQTRFVSVRVDDDAAPTLRARASTVAESDVRGARGDDEPMLSAADAERLLKVVGEHCTKAFDRMYLSDARGVAIVLEGTTLRLGERTIDLTTPLEWRGFLFHESGGRVATIYLATWVRQAESEAVLVSPMPESTWVKDLQASGARDLKLMQSTPDEPPPRDLRLAIDRVFMLPLRQALDKAPRISRVPPPPPRARPEGHL